MARVHSKNTSPELIVRKELQRLGFRYSLNSAHLPGKPDIVFPKRQKLIFIHGCFWHQHKGCKASKRPTSNIDYWSQKLERNISRDKRNITTLKKSGWEVLVLWECQIKKPGFLTRKLMNFMQKSPCTRSSSASSLKSKGARRQEERRCHH